MIIKRFDLHEKKPAIIYHGKWSVSMVWHDNQPYFKKVDLAIICGYQSSMTRIIPTTNDICIKVGRWQYANFNYAKRSLSLATGERRLRAQELIHTLSCVYNKKNHQP